VKPVKYDGLTVLDAWKKVVNDDVLDDLDIRPEIARSWARCKNYGLDPWSLDFPKADEKLLEAYREKYRHVMDAASPVMQYMLTIFNCNCSIADMHGFVFDLITPLSSYPRTLGTYVSEALHGTGNLPLAMCEKKSIRVDGYEHFRAVSQTYSGVSAIFRISPAEEFVLNINEPFVPLPENALDTCIAAGKLVEKLCVSRREMFSCLSSAAFFDPILVSDKLTVIVVDPKGTVLTANKQGKAIIADYDERPYASCSLEEYLKDKSQLDRLLTSEGKSGEYPLFSFKSTKRNKNNDLHLLRKREVVLMNGMTHHILVFDSQAMEKNEEKPPVFRAVEKDVEYIGQSDAWQKVDAIVHSVAGHKSNVMIMGETGTGKEVIAKAIHRLSGRKGEFVAINCGALPRDLLASELFGYEGGAFTGARSSGAKGKFEYANGGTLFLDEIGEMPLDMQVSLLRVIQEQSVTRVGSNKPIPFDVRVIAATNRDMNQMLAKKEFRADLWYRLSVIEIHLPLLCERGGDVTLLAEYFNKLLGESLQITWHPLSQSVKDLLEGYSWPGNVRELKNVMEKALLLSNGDAISPDNFPDRMRTAGSRRTERIPDREPEPEPVRNPHRFEPFEPPQPAEERTPKQRREQLEKEKIITLLEQERGNISKVAEKMNISRNTLYRRIDKLGIQIQVRAFSNDEH
jgi:transcriptional regulator with PAS, ATPase and Fis domain